MKRYGIFPIIGNGSGGNPYRASVSDLSPTVLSVALIPTNSNGTPKWHFAFCNVSANDFTSVVQLTNSYVCPDYALDGQLSAMDQTTLAGMKQSMEAYNLDGAGTHLSVNISDLTISYRTLLISIFQQIDPLASAAQFNNSFDPGTP